jgi:hypothetical protein
VYLDNSSLEATTLLPSKDELQQFPASLVIHTAVVMGIGYQPRQLPPCAHLINHMSWREGGRREGGRKEGGRRERGRESGKIGIIHKS